MSVIGRDTDVVEPERHGVQALGMVGEEVEDSPVFLDVGFRVGLECVDYIWERHCVTSEENGEVVPHDIEVTLQVERSNLTINDRPNQSSIKSV